MFARSSVHGPIFLFAVFATMVTFAADRKPVLEGEWSKPVADARGYMLRGRLCIDEERVSDERREFSVYIELQEAGDSIGRPLKVYCQLTRYDYRDKTGLHCELLDADKKPIESRPPPFGGAVPQSIWVVIPTDGSIRLRTTPFGMYQPGAMVICPALGQYWAINNDDANEYTLTGRFTVDPPKEKDEIGLEEHIWRGTIELPPLKIKRKP